MKIDYGKLKKKFWFEDKDGNMVSEDDPTACNYVSCFPFEITTHVYTYRYHPTNPIIKFLCNKSKRFYNWISKGKSKTFESLIDLHTTIGKTGQDCILAMANSGDFTLEEAIWVYANSCERCMNVLLRKYLKNDGYEEHSYEWEKAGTSCDFCRDEENV